MNETKDDLKREKVRIVPISNIEDFPNHPFQVKDDESMAQLVESIRMNGVLNPVIALKIDENHYLSKICLVLPVEAEIMVAAVASYFSNSTTANNIQIKTTKRKNEVIQNEEVF